jgi:osmotically-inducible protein OsmY
MKPAVAILLLTPFLFSSRVPVAFGAHSGRSAFFASAAEKNFAVTDDSLYDAVRRRLADDPVVKGGGIQVEVKDGNVTLRGKVDDDKARERAAKITKKIKGVRGVSNELTVEK